MNGPRILFVEDEPGLVITVGDLLRAEGYHLQVASDGESALKEVLGSTKFDLVLLDIMLPGINGFEVCRTLRRQGIETPIFMLTAKGDVRDRVAGLRLGADDYLVKPFEPTELLARIEALLRRAGSRRNLTKLRFGDIEIDFVGMTVCRAGHEIELSAMEFQLLTYLVENAGSVLTRAKILRDVWGFQNAPRTRTVDVHVTWLRRKIEPNRTRPTFIRTVRGVGYKFVGENDPPQT